ncbi:tyrosine-protein phosphatase non-receptor type 23 isoform X2 [Ceratina calcarata]|uniref:Tyrosine-protein phosphatase non-receptor type 23 isoform X2 n=1 Tax=Ceratina calcarata TaxID=156304 RepID=A0AAJ7RZT3_9HYME|nr:tyrosine-protein phosphatase non-receptor type 23 isoform X2 [Ceratina calcarata]
MVNQSRDTYANMVCSLANIRFEIISILYNIGAMHTQLGALTERTSAEGMKMACAHFQCAAWAFEHLKNSYPQPPGVDLAPELMTFMHQLCLAQAQECILEKSMLDNRKPSIVAKVARQIVDYFNLALITLEQGGSEDGTISDTVGTKIYKSWKVYLKFKKAYHLAVTYLYQGLAAEEQRKMGERVAFYNSALASLNEAQLLYSNIPGEKTIIEEALTFTNDVIEGKRKAAKNENEFIYHEEVPEKETLPTVKGAPLVKGISFSINDPEVSGPDIFARLVPMKVHEASSMYSEEKAKILRSVGSKVEEKDQQLNTYLTSLKLEHMSLWDPDAQTTEWERLPLPEELVERCAAMNAKNGIQDLVEIMDKLSETCEDVEKILKEIKKLLLDEEQKEKEYQDAVGKRPPSIVATDLTREAKKYEEAYNKALETNHSLNKGITKHVKNLELLSQPLAELIAHIPSPTAYLSEQNTDKSHSAIELERMQTKELKRILNKVDEMRRQRSELHSKLRDSIAQDDLTRLLVTATSDSGPLDRLFADQLSKHQNLVSLIDQNLAAQDNILTALTDAYAQTANVRKGVEEILKRREHKISSLIASYDAYENLLAKSSRGLEFYRKLEINVSKLLQRVKSTCKVQDEEREQILAQDSNKNSQEKIDPVIAAGYDPNRGRSGGSGLKLKDYLNNRPETIQNQYYNVYKGQSKQMDVAGKSYLNETVNKATTVHPGGITGIDAMSADKSMQQYYPSPYTDYKTNLPYSHESSTYNENAALNQTYMHINSTDAASTYPQVLGTNTMTDTTAQYPVNSYISNGQYSTTVDSQHKYPSVQSQYNYPSSALQYETYQPTVDYAGYNVAQYPPNLDKTGTAAKTEMSTQPSTIAQTMPLSSTVNKTTDMHAHLYTTATQPGQQYVLEQQKFVPQEPVPIVQNQHVLPDNQMQNYTLPQMNQNEVPSSQSYAAGIYYNAADLQTQQVASNQTIPAASNIPGSGHYVQPQYMNASIPQSVHSTTSLPVKDVGDSYSPAMHGSNILQYPQQGTVDQSKQVYTDKGYQYGSQTLTNDAALNYPSTYHGIQHPGSVSYPQTMLPTDTTGTYAYASTTNDAEMIQSHAKSSTSIQNYPQSYQYPQQYSGYGGYAHGYTQGYNYVQGNQAANAMEEPYKNQMGYTYNPTSQCYEYNPGSVQTSQPVQVSQPTDSAPQINTGINNVSQQQETSARYTNASNNSTVSQTPSSQYSSQTYLPESSSDNYYTTQYGLQMQNQTSVSKQETYSNYNQTYMQAANNGTNTTTSTNPTKSTTKSETSNVDLLADLDVTINHAPLVPEVRPANKTEETKSQDEAAATTTKDEDANNESTKDDEQPAASSSVVEDKTENENLQIVWDTWSNDVQPKKDPLGDPAALQKFVSEVEKYEKFVDSLLVKTLSGATNLDIKWKEVQEFEERESSKQSCTVALAHSSENRVMECIPYDTTRVQMSTTDVPNYINASHIMEITQWIPTGFIITQAPLPNKLEVFWTMIWEQESEIIACLISDSQLSGEIYWPINEEDVLNVGSFTIRLKKRTNHMSYVQRVISVHNTKKNSEKTVVHMQFLTWPSNGFPSSPGPLLSFSTDVMTEQALRHCTKPVVVHCLDGGALSSLFLVAAATVCHIRAGCGIVNVPLVFKGLLKCRKQIVNKESLLFAYQLVLYHAQDILMKRGILSSTRSTFENFEGLKGSKDKTNRKMHPSDDFLHSLGINAQRADAEQGRQKGSTGSGITHSVAASIQEKSKEGAIDPLSQLDPLWSIRR